jgi:hypothetical protein
VQDVIAAILRGGTVADERVEGGRIDRAGALAAAEDQQASLVRADPEALSRGGAIGPRDRRRHGATGDQVLAALAARNREREAHAPGPAGE